MAVVDPWELRLGVTIAMDTDREVGGPTDGTAPVRTDCVLRQERSHATEQSHGQSLATAPYDQTKCPKPSNETIKTRDKQPQAQPCVQAVMAPMSQPVGGWHVTSMTKHPDDQKVPRTGPLLVESV